MYEQDQNVGSHFFAVKRFARRGKCLDDGEGSLLLVSNQPGAQLRSCASQTPSLVSVKCFLGGEGTGARPPGPGRRANVCGPNGRAVPASRDLRWVSNLFAAFGRSRRR